MHGEAALARRATVLVSGLELLRLITLFRLAHLAVTIVDGALALFPRTTDGRGVSRQRCARGRLLRALALQTGDRERVL